MRLKVLFSRERDGRWIAEIPDFPGATGVRAYGDSRDDAFQRVKAVALETLIGLAEIGERAIDDAISFEAA